jgi:hypothetical protein
MPNSAAVSTVFQRENSLADDELDMWTEYVTLEAGD